MSNKVNADGNINNRNKKAVNRIFLNGRNSCFIRLKDHKPKFLSNPIFRLLNPAKNELGRISKSILDRINTSLLNFIKVDQWKDISKITEWFKNIGNKQKHKFIWYQKFLSNNHERSINNMLQVCWRKMFKFLMTIKKYTMQESLYYLMKKVGGWEKMVCLMWQWGRIMAQRYVNLLGHFYQIKSV